MAFLTKALSCFAPFLLAGCANLTSPLDEDYRLGDNLVEYCESTSPEVRQAGRVLARRAGVELIDLCRAGGFVKHLLVEGDEDEI